MPGWAPPDWRDAGAYAPVLGLGRTALAWELLRRDPAYRAFVAHPDAPPSSLARWGLHFLG
jgi:hypothetical protein